MLSKLAGKILFKKIFWGFLIMATIFLGIACYQDPPQNKDWYKYAEEYIKADELMIQNLTQKKETFPEDYESRHQAELKLFNSPSPTMPEIEQLLKSQNPLDKKVALVTIKVKQIYSVELISAILKLNDPKDNYFIKSYSYQYFKLFDRDKIKQYEDKLIELISWETNEAFIIATMPTLSQMERTKSIPLFVRFFKTGTDGLKRATYAYLKKAGNGYLDEIKASLKKENAVGALTFIKQMESGRR